jgi:hypothetical protein
MQNSVRYSDTRFADRIELWVGTALAVAGLVLIAICLASFVQLLLELEHSVKPAILKMRGGPSLCCFCPTATKRALSAGDSHDVG